MPLIATELTDAGSASLPATPIRSLVFYLAGQAYALALEDVREIVPLAWLSRPPGLPSVLAGFLNLEGQAVAVLRLDRLFGLTEMTPGLYTPLVLLRDAAPPLALMVERVTSIITAGAEGLLPMPADASFNDCAAGLLMEKGRNIVLLSARRILSEKEQQCLAEFEALEQARLNDLRVSEP